MARRALAASYGLHVDMTAAQVQRWAEHHGVADLLTTRVEEITHLIDQYLHWSLCDLTLTQLFDPPASRRHTSGLTEHKTLCVDLLCHEAEQRKIGRAAALEAQATRTPPGQPKLLAFYQKLDRLRAAMTAVTPAAPAERPSCSFDVLLDPTGLAY